MTESKSSAAGYRKSLTSEEATELASIDAEAAVLDKRRRELSLRRYVIVNRVCSRARASRRGVRS